MKKKYCIAIFNPINIYFNIGYNDRSSHGSSRQGSGWDSRGNRGNYGQFNEDPGSGSRDWSRSASSRSYGNRPSLRGSGSDRKPFDEPYKDPLPGM